MSLTVRDQLAYLVLYTRRRAVPAHPLPRARRAGRLAASPDRRSGGRSRRSISAAGRCSSSRPSRVRSLLTGAASSAPLAGAWTDVGARVVEWSPVPRRFLPVLRIGSGTRSDVRRHVRHPTSWIDRPTEQLRDEYNDPPGTNFHRSWRPCTTTSSQLQGWTRRRATRRKRSRTIDVLAGTAEEVGDEGPQRSLTVAVSRRSSAARSSRPGPPPTSAAGTAAPHRRGRVPPRHRPRWPRGSVHGDGAHPGDRGPGGSDRRASASRRDDYPDDVVELYGRDTLPDGALGRRPGTAPADRGGRAARAIPTTSRSRWATPSWTRPVHLRPTSRTPLR